MEKKQWVRPNAVGQVFEANEYVAACYSLACNVGPGLSGASNGSNWSHDEYGNDITHASAGTTGTCADANVNRVLTDNGGVVESVGEYNKDQGWINGGFDKWIDNNHDGIVNTGDTIYLYTLSGDKNRRWNHRGTLEALDASNPNHS